MSDPTDKGPDGPVPTVVPNTVDFDHALDERRCPVEGCGEPLEASQYNDANWERVRSHIGEIMSIGGHVPAIRGREVYYHWPNQQQYEAYKAAQKDAKKTPGP